MSIRREVALNFATYFGPKVASLGVFALIVPIALHSLGQDRYAVLMTILLFVGFVPLLDTGISYALTFRYSRALQRDRHAGAVLLREHWRIYFAAGAALALIMLFVFPWIFRSANAQFGDELSVTAASGTAAVFFMFLSGYYRAVLVAGGKSHVVNLIDFVSDVLRGVAIGVGAGLYRDLGLTMILIALAFAIRWALMMLNTRRIVMRSPINNPVRIRKRSLHASARVGAPFALSALVTVVFGTLDKAVIARMQSLSDLASYSLSYDITTKGWLLVWAVNSAVLPVLMRLGHARDDAKITRIFAFSWVSVSAIAIMVYLPLNLFQPQLVGWWVGDAMANSTRSYIAVFSLSSLFYFAVTVFYGFFQASGRVMVIAKSYMIGLVFYLVILAFGAVNGQTLIMAAAHLVLWIVVTIVMAYFFIIERGRRYAASKAY